MYTNKREGVPMAKFNSNHRGTTRALIRSQWYLVQHIDTAAQTAVVTDSTGKDQLVNLRDIDIFVDDLASGGKNKRKNRDKYLP